MKTDYKGEDMKINIETVGVPTIKYDTKIEKYVCEAEIIIDGKETKLILQYEK